MWGVTHWQRHEQTMFRLERIAQAAYEVKVQSECEFVLPEDAELEDSTTLRKRGALYGRRTEDMWFD